MGLLAFFDNNISLSTSEPFIMSLSLITLRNVDFSHKTSIASLPITADFQEACNNYKKVLFFFLFVFFCESHYEGNFEIFMKIMLKSLSTANSRNHRDLLNDYNNQLYNIKEVSN